MLATSGGTGIPGPICPPIGGIGGGMGIPDGIPDGIPGIEGRSISSAIP